MPLMQIPTCCVQRVKVWKQFRPQTQSSRCYRLRDQLIDWSPASVAVSSALGVFSRSAVVELDRGKCPYVCLSVCLSVRPSHADINSKLMTVRSRSFRRRVAQIL